MKDTQYMNYAIHAKYIMYVTYTQYAMYATANIKKIFSIWEIFQICQTCNICNICNMVVYMCIWQYNAYIVVYFCIYLHICVYFRNMDIMFVCLQRMMTLRTMNRTREAIFWCNFHKDVSKLFWLQRRDISNLCRSQPKLKQLYDFLLFYFLQLACRASHY